MKIHKMLFTLLICMISFAVFSNTSEPKQKQKTEFTKEFTKTLEFVNTENVKVATTLNVEKSFVLKETKITKPEIITEKYIFDVGWQNKENYNIKNKNYISLLPNKHKNLDNRIRNDC